MFDSVGLRFLVRRLKPRRVHFGITNDLCGLALIIDTAYEQNNVHSLQNGSDVYSKD